MVGNGPCSATKEADSSQGRFVVQKQAKVTPEVVIRFEPWSGASQVSKDQANEDGIRIKSSHSRKSQQRPGAGQASNG